MKLKKPGKNTLEIEVSHIAPKGIWLHVKGKEHFLSYKNFPWFKKAQPKQIQKVSLVNNHYLRWNALDIDLELESIENLNKYSLKYA